MAKQYTLWDPNLGDIHFAEALAATPSVNETITTPTITTPTISGGTMDGTVIGGTTPAAASLSTTQIGSLTNSTTFTATATTQVSVQVTTITATSVALFGLKTVGGTPGNTPRLFSVAAGTPGKATVVADNGDTSTYNLAFIG